jgi:hypothetical protein
MRHWNHSKDDDPPDGAFPWPLWKVALLFGVGTFALGVISPFTERFGWPF